MVDKGPPVQVILSPSKGFCPASRLLLQNHLSAPPSASGTQLPKSSHALSRFCAYACIHRRAHTLRTAPAFPQASSLLSCKVGLSRTHPTSFHTQTHPLQGEVILYESETTLSQNPRFSVD